MSWFSSFQDFVKQQEPLAPFTYLRLGGPAQFLATPRSAAELASLVKAAHKEKLPLRVLGGGCNVVVRDEGVAGVVIRLGEPAFALVEVKANTLRVAAGCPLNAAIAEAARAELAGLEPLMGIPGSVGGALRSNAGSRSGNLTQVLHAIEWLTPEGELQRFEQDEIPLDQVTSLVDGSILTHVEFALQKDQPEDILKRMRRLWIQKKARQPLSFEPVARLFKSPKGLPIEQYLEEAGVQEMTVGGAALSERNPNYVVAREGATARDVLRLIDLVKTAVADRLGQQLQLSLAVW